MTAAVHKSPRASGGSAFLRSSIGASFEKAACPEESRCLEKIPWYHIQLQKIMTQKSTTSGPFPKIRNCKSGFNCQKERVDFANSFAVSCQRHLARFRADGQTKPVDAVSTLRRRCAIGPDPVMGRSGSPDHHHKEE